MPDRLPPNWPPHDEERACEMIDEICTAIDGARMKDCLLASAVVVSNVLEHYPGGRAEGIRQFVELLKDCRYSIRKIALSPRTIQ